MATLQALEFPRFDVNGVSSLGQDTFTDLVIAPTTHSFNVNATKILSKHTFKFGMDYRKLMLNFLQLSQPSGQYGFSQRWTQLDPDQGGSTYGFGMASLLLGVPFIVAMWVGARWFHGASEKAYRRAAYAIIIAAAIVSLPLWDGRLR